MATEAAAAPQAAEAVPETAPAAAEAAAPSASGAEMEVDVLHAIETQLQAPGLDPDLRKKLTFARDLLKRYNLYKEAKPLRVGQLVKWKPGMANRRMPQGDDVGIVSRVYDAPIFDPSKKDAGSPYFHEPLDVAVAILDTDGEFIEFHYDSRRLQAVEDAECAPRVVAQLRELLATLLSPSDLHVGDSVRWKPGMKNKKRPKDNEPAVVAEVFPEPVYDRTKDAGGQYFREPLQVKVALLDEDDEFVLYHFDPRRLERVPPGEEGKPPPRPPVTPMEGSDSRPRRASFGPSDASAPPQRSRSRSPPRPNPFAGLYSQPRPETTPFTQEAFQQEAPGAPPTAPPWGGSMPDEISTTGGRGGSRQTAAGADEEIHGGGASRGGRGRGRDPPFPFPGGFPGGFPFGAGSGGSGRREREEEEEHHEHGPECAHEAEQPRGPHPPMPAQGEFVPGTFTQAPPRSGEGDEEVEGGERMQAAPPSADEISSTRRRRESTGDVPMPPPQEPQFSQQATETGPHPPMPAQGEFVPGTFTQGEPVQAGPPPPPPPPPTAATTIISSEPQEDEQHADAADAEMTTAEMPHAATPGGGVD